RLAYRKVRPDLVLESEFPLIRGLGMKAPKATMGKRQNGILLTALPHAFWEVPCRSRGPIEVRALRPASRREFAPPLLRLLPLGLQERPQGGAVDPNAVVEIHPVRCIDLARGLLADVNHRVDCIDHLANARA